MDGFERRKEQSKEEIRKAAWELFSQFGADKVSMMDIASKAGVSPATIYNNFSNKEALVREFVNSAVETLVNGVRQAIASGHSYHEKMAAFFHFISATLANGKPSGNAVFHGSLALQNDPEIKEIRLKAEEEMIALLMDLIEEGKQQGQVDQQLTEEALRIYFVVFMDVFSDPRLQHRYYQQPALIGELGSLMLYGLRGQQKIDYLSEWHEKELNGNLNS